MYGNFKEQAQLQPARLASAHPRAELGGGPKPRRGALSSALGAGGGRVRGARGLGALPCHERGQQPLARGGAGRALAAAEVRPRAVSAAGQVARARVDSTGARLAAPTLQAPVFC